MRRRRAPPIEKCDGCLPPRNARKRSPSSAYVTKGPRQAHGSLAAYKRAPAVQAASLARARRGSHVGPSTSVRSRPRRDRTDEAPAGDGHESLPACVRSWPGGVRCVLYKQRNRLCLSGRSRLAAERKSEAVKVRSASHFSPPLVSLSLPRVPPHPSLSPPKTPVPPRSRPVRFVVDRVLSIPLRTVLLVCYACSSSRCSRRAAFLSPCFLLSLNLDALCGGFAALRLRRVFGAVESVLCLLLFAYGLVVFFFCWRSRPTSTDKPW